MEYIINNMKTTMTYNDLTNEINKMTVAQRNCDVMVDSVEMYSVDLYEVTLNYCESTDEIKKLVGIGHPFLMTGVSV